MASKRELYNSKQGIGGVPQRPSIPPGTARRSPDTGMADVGKALMSLGQQLHQVNVARQTANAVAKYKMQSAKFMLKMQNADPSTVDYDNAFAEFQAQAGELTAGVSRDAAQIIESKIAMAAASDYKQMKKMEYTNARNLVMAEAPVVLDGMVREQAKAEANGDPKRAKQARQNYEEWLEGVSPSLRPGERMKLTTAYDATLNEARANEEKQRVYAAILANPAAALELIPKLKYQTPQQMLTLQKAAKAQIGHKVKQAQLQEAILQDSQSESILDQYLETGQVPPVQDLHPDLQPQVDALNDKIANQITDVTDGELHSVYYDLKDDLDNVNVVTDVELLAAATVLPAEKIRELREDSRLNKQLRPKKDEVKSMVGLLNTKFDAVIETASMFDDSEIASVVMREVEQERALVIREIKQLFADGKKRNEILMATQKTFEGSKKGILESRFTKWIKTGAHDFTKKYEKSNSEQERRRAIINLMMAGDYEREIEAAVQAGWFDE